MPRNRMIKPEFWSSEKLTRVSRDARLLFIGLWNFCDDYGFCINSNRRIIGDIFPLDEKVTEALIGKWLAELIEITVVIPLDYKGKSLLFIKSWGEHQTVQHKSKRAYVELDDIEQVITLSLESHEGLIASYLESHAPKRKKKEKEESNKEKVKYFDAVLLLPDEMKMLKEKYPDMITLMKAVEYLSDYKMSKGKKYDSDYHVLRSGWLFDKFNQPMAPLKDTINLENDPYA